MRSYWMTLPGFPSRVSIRLAYGIWTCLAAGVCMFGSGCAAMQWHRSEGSPLVQSSISQLPAGIVAAPEPPPQVPAAQDAAAVDDVQQVQGFLPIPAPAPVLPSAPQQPLVSNADASLHLPSATMPTGVVMLASPCDTCGFCPVCRSRNRLANVPPAVAGVGVPVPACDAVSELEALVRTLHDENERMTEQLSALEEHIHATEKAKQQEMEQAEARLTTLSAEMDICRNSLTRLQARVEAEHGEDVKKLEEILELVELLAIGLKPGSPSSARLPTTIMER